MGAIFGTSINNLFLISRKALLDDTNGNTVNINNQPGVEGAGDGCTVGGGMAPTTADSVAMLHSPSNDDLSQSLSEYTDADESISAPTELLAEVMLRSTNTNNRLVVLNLYMFFFILF